MFYRSRNNLGLTFLTLAALCLLALMSLGIGVSTGLTQATPSQSLGWKISCVDCPKQFASVHDRSLRIDQNGRPHIAYGSDHLYYAWQDGISWRLSTVDPGEGVWGSASLALDTNNNPKISYFMGNIDLRYAYQQANTWQFEVVDRVGGAGGYTSLALGSDGKPDIVYSVLATFNDFHGALNYAYVEADQWLTETVDTDANVGRGILSMALDANGYPHVVYYHLNSWIDGSLRYAYRDASGWHVQDFNTTVDAAQDASLVVDNQGYPHVSYYDPINYDLKYAYKDAIQWHTETVDATGSVGSGSALQIAGDGKLYISYLSVDSGVQKV